VNALDIGIVVAMVVAAVAGWRFGFVARLFAWGGVALGLVVAMRYVPRVVTKFGGTSSDDRITIALLFLVSAATLGTALGLMASTIVYRYSPRDTPLPRWDRAGGAILGCFGVLVLVWATIPTVATANGWPARMARRSVLIDVVDHLSPRQPEVFAAWGRAISEAPYPLVLAPLEAPPDVGAPPRTSLPREVDKHVRRSVVEVSGDACGRNQNGSGWVYESGRVVTAAHVVAGEGKTRVVDAGGEKHRSTVIAFDPKRDLAVLRVAHLDAPALARDAGHEKDRGAVYGHPRGGELRATPARVAQKVGATGTDIYRTSSTHRSVFVLAAALAPGDSGGPLVNRKGKAIGLAIAVDPDPRRHTSYALADDEVRTFLASVRDQPVPTGTCLR
jgi:uncharacterized membrane protein required for colicin V production